MVIPRLFCFSTNEFKKHFFYFIYIFFNSDNVVYFILQSEKKDKEKVEEEGSKIGKGRGNVKEREHWGGMIELTKLEKTI